MENGTIQTLQVIEQSTAHYVVGNEGKTFTLPTEEVNGALSIGDTVDVFLINGRATLQLPQLTIGLFAWVTVCERSERAIYVDIGTIEPIIILANDLPALTDVWPQIGDSLYVTMKRNRREQLFAVPAKERQFFDLMIPANNIELNEQVTGTVIRVAREGSVMLTEQGYRCFIHRSERTIEPRLGETITGRVIEIKEDGTLNVSLKPLKHERINDDAQTILMYLQKNDGEMPFTDNSSPDDIRQTFSMSKSAFKRALGHLMKQQQVEQVDGETRLLK